VRAAIRRRKGLARNVEVMSRISFGFGSPPRDGARVSLRGGSSITAMAARKKKKLEMGKSVATPACSRTSAARPAPATPPMTPPAAMRAKSLRPSPTVKSCADSVQNCDGSRPPTSPEKT
jgi:hypothetical protein